MNFSTGSVVHKSLFIFKYQCGNVAVPVEQPVHFSDEFKEKSVQWVEEDDSVTEAVEEKLKTGTDEGYSESDDEGTVHIQSYM